MRVEFYFGFKICLITNQRYHTDLGNQDFKKFNSVPYSLRANVLLKNTSLLCYISDFTF